MSTPLEHIQQIKKAIRSSIILIVIISAIAASITGFIVRRDKGNYQTYSKIFPLSINKASGNSPMDAIKSQFGISDKTDFDKIYNVRELVTSKTISHNIVRTRLTSSKYKTIADWLIADFNSNIPMWGNKIDASKLDSIHRIYTASDILQRNLNIENDIKTGFTTIVTKSVDDKLCIVTNQATLKELSSFYIKLVTEKPRHDLGRIKTMRDSLKDELYAVERAIAGFQDANQLSVKYTTNIPQAKLIRTRAEIEALYSVTATSYQNAKFKLLSESPIFQVLDMPGEPLAYNKDSWKKMFFLTFIGVFLLLSIFVCRKVFGRMIVEEFSKS